MNRRGPIARVLALLLVGAVSLVFVPRTAAQENATLAGTIVTFDDQQPVDGAILHAGDLRTGRIYSSAATDGDGGFVLSGLSPAVYELVVEKDDGLYLVGTPLELEEGQERDVQLAIQPEVADDPKTAKEKEEDREMGFLNNPLFASLTVIGASILFGALISEIDSSDEGIASPFMN